MAAFFLSNRRMNVFNQYLVRICVLLSMMPLFCLAAERVTKEAVIDNDKVQVVRLTYPVGSESGVHSHEFAHRTVYVEKAGTLGLIPDGDESKLQVIQLTQGQILYVPAQTHNVRNLGNTQIVLIETEIK